MTLEQLRSFTRKRLAELAKEHRLPHWHTLRKEDLIEALDKLYHRQELEEAAKAQRKSGKSNRKTAIRTPKLNKDPSGEFTSRSKQAVGTNPLRGSGPADWLEVHVLDNQWFKVCWQLTTGSLTRAEVALGAEWRYAVPTMRLIEINSENSTAVEEVVEEAEISGRFREWYLTIPNPGEAYKIELGLKTSGHRFYTLLKSDKISTECDSAFRFKAMTEDKVNESESGPAACPENSLQNLKDIAELLRGRADEEVEALSTEPFGVEVKVTINGTADPEANVTMQGEWVEVQEDGTFQIEMPLADGRQVVPIVQATKGGREKRTIILALEQNRRELEPQIARSLLQAKPR